MAAQKPKSSSEALRLANTVLSGDVPVPPSRGAKVHGAATAPTQTLRLATDAKAATQTEASILTGLQTLNTVVWRLDLRSGRSELAPEAVATFEQVFNLDPQCLEEGRFGFTTHAHPDDRDRILAMLAAGAEKPFRSHFRIIDRDGAERWIQIKVSSQGNESLWFWAENDTAEKAEAEQQKRTFASRILSSLLGSGLETLEPKTMLSHALMTLITEKWQPLVEEKGIRWTGPDLAPLAPDAVLEGSDALLILMMDCLFNNAVEACTPLKSGAKSWIRFEFFEDKSSLYFALTDSGTGIPLVHRGQIFEPFFSTHKESSPGLGLTLARTAAEWHGGMLRLDHFSKNTRFVAQIPKKFRGSVE